MAPSPSLSERNSRKAFRSMLQAGIPRQGQLRATWHRRSQFIRAVGAKLIGFDDFAFAVGAGGVQVAFAVGAEVEAGAD